MQSLKDYDYPEHYADDVWAAIELAEELKLSGKYDLFRGQSHIFGIQPSALRSGIDRSDVEKKLNAFGSWVYNTPDLSSLHGDMNAILAVAQHYGLKTPFLDFSYSPKVAGFFATDGGCNDDTGTIICVNKDRFIESWKSINERHYETEGQLLTDIVEIDVKNLWRLQAQEGAFLRCHVDTTLLEMFSFFLHIYFPQKSNTKVLDQECIYPSVRSHLEVLLDQYFLIDSYPERDKRMKETFGREIKISEDGIENDIAEYFLGDRLPGTHGSWETEFAQKWFQEPDERYKDHEDKIIDVIIVLPEFESSESLEEHTTDKITEILGSCDDPQRKSINWNIVSEDGSTLYISGEGTLEKEKNKYTEFAVSEMVSVIYSGMRYLPYTNSQIIRAISRYLTMISFGAHNVIDDWQGIEISGGRVRGRGVCSKNRIYESLREDFFKLVKPEKLSSSGGLDFRDTFYLARFVKSSYVLENFIELFIEDIIQSQAATAIEGRIVGLNPMRIDVLGES